jgi:hypothetical protein
LEREFQEMTDLGRDKSRAMVAGTLNGTVLPFRPMPALPATDAREHALGALADFIALIQFRREMGAGVVAQTFAIKREDIHLYEPDDVHKAKYPSIGFIPAEAQDDYYALGPAAELEDTRDVYGLGTVLMRACDHVETFVIEAYTSKHSLGHAIKAGIQAVFRMLEQSSALRLKLPLYFDQVASFDLEGSNRGEDPDTIRNRRRDQLICRMQVPQVYLRNYVELRPETDFGGVEATDIGPEVDVTVGS